MLHAADKSPVKFSRVCARDGRPVAWEDLVKGYEYAKGQFVVITKQDFQAAAVEKTRRVDIIDFVNASEIDDRYFETPYYLAPAASGEHAYALLREAMRTAKRVGIAKFILRDTQHLAAIEVIGDALVLSTMRFADELVALENLALPPVTALRKVELDMAKALVESLASEWEPGKYTDEYRENLMRIIQGKVKGKKVVLDADEQPRQAKVIDLMERLRRSLEERGAAAGTRGRRVGGRPRKDSSDKRRAPKKRSRRAA